MNGISVGRVEVRFRSCVVQFDIYNMTLEALEVMLYHFGLSGVVEAVRIFDTVTGYNQQFSGPELMGVVVQLQAKLAPAPKPVEVEVKVKFEPSPALARLLGVAK